MARREAARALEGPLPLAGQLSGRAGMPLAASCSGARDRPGAPSWRACSSQRLPGAPRPRGGKRTRARSELRALVSRPARKNPDTGSALGINGQPSNPGALRSPSPGRAVAGMDAAGSGPRPSCGLVSPPSDTAGPGPLRPDRVGTPRTKRAELPHETPPARIRLASRARSVLSFLVILRCSRSGS